MCFKYQNACVNLFAHSFSPKPPINHQVTRSTLRSRVSVAAVWLPRIQIPHLLGSNLQAVLYNLSNEQSPWKLTETRLPLAPSSNSHVVTRPYPRPPTWTLKFTRVLSFLASSGFCQLTECCFQPFQQCSICQHTFQNYFPTSVTQSQNLMSTTVLI